MPPSKRDTSSAAIHGPAAKGDAVKVDMAVRAGVDVNATDLGSFSPLHWAAMKGHLTVAAVLVANRAKLSKKDRKGKTPLDFARDGGHAEVAEFLFNALLLEEGKKITQKVKSNGKLSPKAKLGSGARLSTQKKAEATKEMLAWASAIAAERLDVEREEARKAAILRKKLSVADQAKEENQQQQKAEINRLLEALRSARETAATEGESAETGSNENQGKVPTAVSRVTLCPRTGAPKSSPKQPAIPRTPSRAASSSFSSNRAASVSSNRGASVSSNRGASISSSRGGSLSAEKSKKTLMFSGGGVTFVEKKSKSAGSKSPASAAAAAAAAAAKAASTPDRGVSRAESLSAAAKKRAEIDRKFKEAAEKRQRKGEQARLKAEQEALDKKTKRDADRKVRLDALKTKKPSTPGSTATRSSSTAPAISSSRLPRKGGSAGTPTSRSSGGSSTPGASSSSTSSGRKPNFKGVRSSGYGQSPSRLPTPSSGSRRSTPNTASAGRPKTTGSKLSKPSSSLKPEKAASEMDTLEDEYIRVMQGMTAGGEGADVTGAGDQGGDEIVILPAVATPTVFTCDDGTELNARTRRVVRQPNQGFGVVVHSAKYSTWIKIQTVTAEGPFGLAGVEPGDIFVSVNGHSVVGKSHKFLKKCLVGAPDAFEVVVTTEAELPKTRQLRSGTIIRTVSDGGIGVVLYADPYSVSNGCVHRVEEGGPCDVAGIHEGDVFVEVDGANVEAISHKELVEIFNAAGDSISYVVEVGGATNELPGEVPTLPSGIVPRKVVVKRKADDEPLGIVLYSDKDRRGVQLQLVHPQGPFGRAGVVVGDIMVEVDMYNVLDVSHAEVNEALKHAGAEFEAAVIPADAFDSQQVPAQAQAAEASPDASSPPGSPSKPNGLDKMRTHSVIRIPGKGLGIELKSSKSLVGTRAHNVDVAGPMAFAGVNEGDVFVHVNGTPVLNASHKDVIKAFHAAGPEFTVVVIPSDTLDTKLSPSLKSKSVSRVKVRQQEDPYDMGKSTAVSKKQGSGMLNQVGSSSDMRADDRKSWDSTLERDRDLLFSGTSDSMELSQGFKALKKAQQEAQSLQEATKHYEHLFEQQMGGAAHSKRSSAVSSPTEAAGGGSPAQEVSWTAYDNDNREYSPGSLKSSGGKKKKAVSSINKSPTAAAPSRRRFLNL